MAFTVGLTGGIGSGKTTVAELFAKRGVELVDADEIARALTAGGGAGVAMIAQRFGSEYVGPDGALDRARMRELAFAQPQARRDLEYILHPLIRKESARRIAAAHSRYVLAVVPLLLESGKRPDYVQRVLVVDCDPELQIGRVMKRSALTREQVMAIMNAQVSRQERLAGADDVIRNEGNIDALEAQVERLHQRYLDLAGEP